MRFWAAFLWGMAVVAGVWAGPWEDGQASFARQDWKAAASSLARFLQASPNDPQAPAAALLRSVALYQGGDFRGALDGLQKLERTWPQAPVIDRTAYWKAAAALGAGLWAQAEREALAQARFPGAEPFTTRALLVLAQARIGLQKGDAALESLKAFVEKSRESDLLAQALGLWGDEDRKAGRGPDALDHWARASAAQPRGPWDLWARTRTFDFLASAGRWAEASAAVEAAAAVFPQEADRWDQRRVDAARALGQTDRQLAALEALWKRSSDPGQQQAWAADRARAAEAAGLDPEPWWTRASTGPDEDLAAGALVRAAWGRESAGQPAEAASLLAVGLGFRSTWTAEHRGTLGDRRARDLAAAGLAAEAQKAYTDLLSSLGADPRRPDWLLARGRLLLDAGDTIRALADLGALLKDFPQGAQAPEAKYLTGLAYLARKEPARAEAWLFPLLDELKSGDLYEHALLARGLAFVDGGQTDLARASLQRLLREVPQGPLAADAWGALGRNAVQGRDFVAGAEAYRQAEALAQDPAARAASLWSRAEALALAGQAPAASDLFARYAREDENQPKAAEARLRRGAVLASAGDWAGAEAAWADEASRAEGQGRVPLWGARAEALLRLGRPDEAWTLLEAIDAVGTDPGAWFRWGQAALALGQDVWGLKAYQALLTRHPSDPSALQALPRAAGALLAGGQGPQALARYADYFKASGRRPEAAPVARAAAAAAQAYPQVLAQLVKASASWNLAPEVAAEFALAWAQARLDSDSSAAQGELQALAQAAPWASQRSEALAILGRWFLAQGRTQEARTRLEAAASLGDDLAVFRARWALALVTEKEGDLAAAARQREAAEKAAGPGVPREFRVQILKEAADTWTKAGRTDEAQRVLVRASSLGS